MRAAGIKENEKVKELFGSKMAKRTLEEGTLVTGSTTRKRAGELCSTTMRTDMMASGLRISLVERAE